MNNFIILTGSPGTGKTTLIRELSKRGYACVEEPARIVIAEQRALGTTALPEKDAAAFVELLLKRSIEQFEKCDKSKKFFFDRGTPDLFAYAKVFRISTEAVEVASKEYRYAQKVFILPPWKEIYQNDEERKMPFELSDEFHEFLKEGYEKFGYKLIEVPCVSGIDRVNFILDSI